MSDRVEVLREAMTRTGTSQSELARLSGVRQPSISAFLSGRVEFSDEQLERLLSCMGYRLHVVRRMVPAELTRAEDRSWRLHRRLSRQLTRETLKDWAPTMAANVERLKASVTGQPHRRNLDRWTALIEAQDEPSLHRVLTGLDRDAIEMREVSPLSGLLSQEDRTAALAKR